MWLWPQILHGTLASELVRVGRRLRVSEDSWSIALLQLIHHSFRSACPTQSPTKILSGTQTHTHCTSRHILRNVAIFSPTRALGKQSPICHLSVQLEPKQTNTKSYDLSKSSYSFKKLCNARTNKQLLFSKQGTKHRVSLFYECTNSRWKGHIERKMDFTLGLSVPHH